MKRSFLFTCGGFTTEYVFFFNSNNNVHSNYYTDHKAHIAVTLIMGGGTEILQGNNLYALYYTRVKLV